MRVAMFGLLLLGCVASRPSFAASVLDSVDANCILPEATDESIASARARAVEKLGKPSAEHKDGDQLVLVYGNKGTVTIERSDNGISISCSQAVTLPPGSKVQQ